MNTPKYFLNSLFILAFFSFSSCSCCKGDKTKKAAMQKISINIQTEPSSLDARKARSLGDVNIIKTFNEGLYRVEKSGNVAPAIAESCTLLDDQKTYVIKLKETLWSNGDPLTAHDFIYSWQSSLSKDFPSPNASFLFSIRNAKACKDGLLPASMLGAHTQGDYTLVIELENPTPYFLELLTMPIYFPINPSVATENVNWSQNAEDYICNGPFKLNSWSHNNEIIGIKNKRYWDKKSVKLDEIKMVMIDEGTAYSMYLNKELDLVGSPYSQLPTESLASLEEKQILKKSPLLGTSFIRTNVKTYPLENKSLRRSLATAINRKDLIDHVLFGGAEVATGLIPTSMGLAKTPYFTDGDLKLAVSLLNDACKEMNVSKKKMPPLSFIYVAYSKNHKIAQALQEQWRKVLGINVELEPLESKVFYDRLNKGDYQLAYGSWIADFKDPINFLEIFKTKNVGTNNTGWESLDYISAIDASYKCPDKEERKYTLAETEKLLIAEMPIIPIYHYTMLHLQDNNLKDVALRSTGSIDFKWAYISD